MYEELIEPHTALVRFIALKFKPSRDDLEDFIQVGYIGLLKSAEKFRGGIKFSSYAYKSIFWEISNYKKKNKYKMKELKSDLVDQKYVSKLDTSSLTPDELEVMKQRVYGYTPIRNIAISLNKSPSTIYRLLQSAIKKLDESN